MRKFIFAAVLSLPLATALTVNSEATTINFDDVADGTIIDTFYSGVTFSNPLGGSIYARADAQNTSAPNVVTIFSPASSPLFKFFNALNGAVDVAFATPQQVVSIDALPVGTVEPLGTPQNRPFLEAYDAANTFLGRVLYLGTLPDACCFAFTSFETLTFTSSSANISKVRFSSQQSQPGPPIFGQFDTLTFNATSTPQVPEPSTWLMLGSGLIALAFARRKSSI